MRLDTYAGQHSSTSDSAVSAFSQAVFAVAAHRPALEDLKATLLADPDFASAHALKGLGCVLLGKSENFTSAGVCLTDVRRCADAGHVTTPSEQALMAALTHAVEGRFAKAAEGLEAHALVHPGELLPLKIANALRFMNGELGHMRRATAAALAAVGPDTPGYGFILGMNAFSLEEAGAMGEAERAGRRAVELEPADAWAVHAVSHVFEMRGRVAAGTRWLNETRGGWSACNNFAYHLAWHLALYELEAGRFDEVLHLYDTEVRPTGSDDFRDMANAVSLLWRLEQLDVDVGGRWEALATIAGRRRTDTSYVFASLHYLLALLARGDLAAADELVAGLGESAAYATDTSVTQHRVARDIGLPLAELLLRAHRTKGHMSWLSTDMVRIAGDLPRIGGSHAQRDLFLRTLIDVAAQAGDRVGFAAVTRMRAELKALDRFAVAAERRAGQARVRSSAVNRLAAAG